MCLSVIELDFPRSTKRRLFLAEAVQLTDLNGWADSPCFSPDGTKIALISNEAGNNDIWIMDANGDNRTQITHDEGCDDYVEWTADGLGLLWSSERGNGDADIWHLDLMTQNKAQINDDAGSDFACRQSRRCVYRVLFHPPTRRRCEQALCRSR